MNKKRAIIITIIIILVVILSLWISGIIPKQIARISATNYLKKNFPKMKLEYVNIEWSSSFGGYAIRFKDENNETYGFIMNNKYFPITLGQGLFGFEENYKEKYGEENNNINNNSKIAVIYFSATGTTEKIAKYISEETNADLVKIEPKEPYTSADLNYNSNCRANREQNDENSRPKIKNKIDVENYDIIYLGYPIWWGTVPKIILTFLDSYNLDGKTVIPFCTSGSTSISQSQSTLEAYDKNIKWLKGKRFNSSTSENDITEWIKELDISKEGNNKMYIKLNNKVMRATLENNLSAEELIKKLKQGDITINMSDYSNFEKVGKLGFDLPRNDKQISTDFGDLILYQGNNFVIYYDKNNWNLTKLGHIDNITQEELKQILGVGNVTITLSLNRTGN